MLSRIPTPARTTTRLVPPRLTSGSGTPVNGTTLSVAPMLMNAWPTIRLAMPTASSLPKSSRHEQRDPEGGPGQEHVEADEDEQADQAELLADDGRDHVGRLVGQEAELLHRVAEADPEDPPRGDRQQGLRGLEAAGLGVGPRVDEGDDALHAVRLGEDQGADEDGGDQGEADEVTPARPRGDQHGEGAHAEHERRPKVLLQQPDDDPEGDDPDEDEAGEAAGRPHEARRTRDRSGEKADHGQLRELAGLQRLSGDVEPAPGAADLHPDAGHQGEDGEGDGAEVQRAGEAPPEVEVDAREDHHGDDPDAGEGQLAEEEIGARRRT